MDDDLKWLAFFVIGCMVAVFGCVTLICCVDRKHDCAPIQAGDATCIKCEAVISGSSIMCPAYRIETSR